MESIDIEIFLSIVRSGSLSSAAKSLYASQATVSSRLSALEKELGITLIKRGQGKRSVELTEAGSEFLTIANKWKMIVSDANRLSTCHTQKRIEISGIPSFNSYYLPYIISTLTEKEENGLTIGLYTHRSPTCYHQCEDRAVDLAFVSNPMQATNVETTRLLEEQFVLLCEPNTSYEKSVDVSVLDIRNEILFDWSAQFLQWHEYWMGSITNASILCDNITMYERILSSGRFWSILPRHAAAQIHQSYPHLHLHTIAPKCAPQVRIIYILKHRHLPLTPAATLMLDAIANGLKDIEGIYLYPQALQ